MPKTIPITKAETLIPFGPHCWSPSKILRFCPFFRENACDYVNDRHQHAMPLGGVKTCGIRKEDPAESLQN